jgi:hypothetical protein
MKILLKESVYNLILEAKKKDILVNKLKFNDAVAERLENMAGNISVWLGKKIAEELKKSNIDVSSNWLNVRISEKITSIIDWYRVGLNGNIKRYETLAFNELFDESKKWHDELEVGDGDINYEEENEIVLDYRVDGFGYYWVDLNTRTCGEEKDRMGHCASTGSGDTLFSLRENIKLNDKFSLNKSHLTASIGYDGTIYQLKGPNNSKPNQKYYKYIFDLLLNGENPSIKYIGSEYDSENDFSLEDLNTEQVKKLYNEKPSFFVGLSGRYSLYKNGLIGKEDLKSVELINITRANIEDFIENKGISDQFIYSLLSGDIIYDDFYGYSDHYEIKDFVDILDTENEKIIYKKLEKYANKEEIEEETLEELLKKYRDESEIEEIIRTFHQIAEDLMTVDYYEHYRKELKDCLETFGDVSVDDNGHFTLSIDLFWFSENFNIPLKEVDSYGSVESVIDNYDIREKFEYDDYYSPDFEYADFNSSFRNW